MRDIALVWGALRNLGGAVRHDPVWALSRVILAPVRLFQHLVATAVVVVIVALVLGLAASFIPPHWTLVRAAANAAVILVLIGIAFRHLTGPLVTHFGTASGDTHGSARFATDDEIAPLTRTGAGLLIGRDRSTGRLLRYDGPAHLLTMAPTRTGKGVGTIIPNLLTADRAVICIDPKGENATITRAARERFGPVHILDPFGVTGQPSAAFNPLDGFDPSGLDIAEEAGTLADALVFDEPGQAGEAHWNEEAKALIAGLVLMIVATEPADQRHLGTLREFLTLTPDAFAALLRRMQEMAVVHWNTIYMQEAIAQLTATGMDVSPDDLTHLSPLIWRHLNFLGRYDFSLPDTVRNGELRPLRNPHSAWEF